MTSLSEIYLCNERPDLASESESLLKRYRGSEEDFISLVNAKFAFLKKLRADFANRPFSLTDSRAPSPKRSRVDQAPTIAAPPKPLAVSASSRASLISAQEVVEIRIKDHNGKSRLTKVKGGTTMSEVLEWYGPRRGGSVLNKKDRVSSDTQVRDILKSGQTLELEIVERRR